VIGDCAHGCLTSVRGTFSARAPREQKGKNMEAILMYVLVIVVGAILVAIAWGLNKGQVKGFQGFTLMEIVIMAIIGVVNGVLGTPNAMLGRFFMTFSGAYGFLAFAGICGGFYLSGPLAGYIVRKPGAATFAETMNGVAQVLSGNPNGAMVLGAGFFQGLMSDVGFAFFGYRNWGMPAIALSGALAPVLQQVPEVYYFGVGDLGLGYNLLALAIRMVSGAVYAMVLVMPIADNLARAGVLKGTALESEIRSRRRIAERPAVA